MNVFGVVFMGKQKYERHLREAEERALSRLIALLNKKDAVYLDTVTLVGDGQTIKDCVFLGSASTSGVGLKVISLFAGQLRPKSEAS